MYSEGRWTYATSSRGRRKGPCFVSIVSAAPHCTASLSLCVSTLLSRPLMSVTVKEKPTGVSTKKHVLLCVKNSRRIQT